MPKLKEIKQLNTILSNHINDLDSQIQLQIKKIKQEYMVNLFEEKLKLLSDICEGEKLDFDQMKSKYLKSRDLHKYSIDSDTHGIYVDEELLDKIILNDKEFYYENKNNGNIYDTNTKIVGIFKNGDFVFN